MSYIDVFFYLGGIISFPIIKYIFSSSSEFGYWEIGDMIVLKKNSDGIEELKILNEGYAELRGWNEEYIFIKSANGGTTRIPLNEINFNKSAIWRKHFAECKETMQKDPLFNPKITQCSFNSIYGNKNESNSSLQFEGKVISAMSEVECDVYLKLAITQENYEIAKLIEKQKEKYR